VAAGNRTCGQLKSEDGRLTFNL